MEKNNRYIKKKNCVYRSSAYIKYIYICSDLNACSLGMASHFDSSSTHTIVLFHRIHFFFHILLIELLFEHDSSVCWLLICSDG